MQLIINHLTRMQKGLMCVAGIDPLRHRHIRPMLSQPMKIEMLSVHGGPFQLRRIVDLGETQFMGKVPEIEDRLFVAENAKVVGELNAQEFWKWNSELAKESLVEVFGTDLKIIEHGLGLPATAAVSETFGLFSLGCYWACEPLIEIRSVHDHEKVRFGFTENGLRFEVPVTDIRCYDEDHVTPSVAAVTRLQQRLQSEPRVLTSIGLSRAYHFNPNDPPMHWLQINNIHLPV